MIYQPANIFIGKFVQVCSVNPYTDGQLQFIELGSTPGVRREYLSLEEDVSRPVEVTVGLAFGNSTHSAIYVSHSD